MLLLLTGCGRRNREQEAEYHIYYVNTDETQLVSVEFEEEVAETQLISRFIDIMNEFEVISEYKSAMPEAVEILDYELDNGELILNFNEAYNEMAVTTEVLCRAAVVKTFGGLPDVSYVTFYINGVQKSDENDHPMYYAMVPDDFVDDTDALNTSTRYETLTLYFASEDGDMLVEETFSKRNDGSRSLPELVMDQLMEGPGEDTLRTVIPEETKLLDVSEKDGICYVNFDSGFLEPDPELKPEIMIYAIVNSLTEIASVSKVQISVNGDKQVEIRGISLDQLFGPDLNYVKVTETKQEDNMLPANKDQQQSKEEIENQESIKKGE